MTVSDGEHCTHKARLGGQRCRAHEHVWRLAKERRERRANVHGPVARRRGSEHGISQLM